MEEQIRQFAIYGDFADVTFDRIANDNFKLNDLALGAAMDVPVEQGEIKIQFNPAKTPGSIRPVFRGYDNKKDLFIGSTRIHYQERSSDIASYDCFLASAIDYLQRVLVNYKVGKIDRIACNGAFIKIGKDKAHRFFEKCFNCELFKDNSDDWSMRINERARIEDLGVEVNQIISAIRGNPVLDMEGNDAGALVLEYDYNTVINHDRIFALGDLKTFSELAKAFRKKVMEM